MNPVRYMAENKVAANLLMAFFIVGGLLATTALQVEVFPEIELDRIYVSVVYPGASPAEVEEGICEPIEQAVEGVDGVRRIQAAATEGHGSVTIELLESAEPDTVLQDVKAAVDRIVTFPNEAERPTVAKLTNRRAVLSVAVYGKQEPHVLREQAEAVRDGLLALPDVTQAELSGVPNYEIAIEVSEADLRRYGLTLERVAQAVRAGALDLPGGSVKTEGGEVLLRTTERRYQAREYEDLVIASRPDGTLLRLKDIGMVRDTFEETDERATYNGEPAAVVEVFRVGNQSPAQVSDAVRRFIEQRRAQLPKTLKLAVWNDRSEMLQARMNLLLKNAGLGLVLVVVVLGLFLELKLSLWVTLGIPISVMGALLLTPWFDVSINMISLFAFILVLGIVVDDAIVVGENAYIHRTFGKSALQAAADGAIEVGRPVTFSILTTIAAFAPLLFVSGTMGKFMRAIPVIVISVLVVSLIESLFVLPAHLSHGKPSDPNRRPGPIARVQQWMDARLRSFIEGPYSRFLRTALHFRYATLALAFISLGLTFGLFAGGQVKLTFLPEVEGDVVRARLSMPFGTPVNITETHLRRVVQAAQDVVRETDKDRGSGTNLRGIFRLVGNRLQAGGPAGARGATGAHLGEVAVWLVESDLRTLTSSEFARRWREKVGEIAGAEQLEFESRLIMVGAPIGIQLAHQRFEVLEEASDRLKARLAEYSGLFDITDSYEAGKREYKLSLRPEARSLGVTAQDLARQVRGAFYGAEALRLQRGRNEVKVMVRYPTNERRSLANVDSMRIRTPDGGEIPFDQAAAIDEGRGYSAINRTDRKRTVLVTSKANTKQANPDEIVSDLRKTLLPQLVADYPGLTYDLEGEQRERNESMGSLAIGFLAALGLIFGLLAIPFRSYSQPLIIMSAIPFGVVGAVLGHVVLGYSISLMSMFGVVALTGVVVNDSLVLIDFINRKRRGGDPLLSSVIEGCRRRFRPILLTTLTTFFALVPMLAETSVQARFLIPMAISLAFGVLFATLITLVLIPALYLILEDIGRILSWLFGRGPSQSQQEAGPGSPTSLVGVEAD